MLDPSQQYLVLQLHLFTTLFMTGVIWFVQVVHYPFLSFISREGGELAAQFHQQRTGWVVMPTMLVELITAIFLLTSTWMVLYSHLFWTNLLALLVIWVVTFFKAVPLHKRLAQQFDKDLLRPLVTVNWIRTVLWTLRAVLLVSFIS